MKIKIAIAALVLMTAMRAAVAGNDTYRLDQAILVTSTEWFLIDNYPTPKKTDPRDSLIFRRMFLAYVDDELRSGMANTLSFKCQKRYLNQLLIHLPEAADVMAIRPRKHLLGRLCSRELRNQRQQHAGTNCCRNEAHGRLEALHHLAIRVGHLERRRSIRPTSLCAEPRPPRRWPGSSFR
jgi:hypothetical protein